MSASRTPEPVDPRVADHLPGDAGDREVWFRQLADLATDGLYIIQLVPEVRFLYLNEAAAALAGFSRQQLYDDPELIRSQIPERDRPLLEAARRHDDPDAWPVVVGLIQPDGSVRTVALREVPVHGDDGTVVAVQGYTTDLTDRLRREAALRTALEDERRAAQRLREVDELRAAFLAAVSHELRTPLASVVGYAETIAAHADRLDRDTVLGMVDRIRHNGRRLQRLLEDLLDVDRLSRSRIEPVRTDTDVGRLVRAVTDGLSGVTTHRFVVEAPPVRCRVDASKVERIVDNLLRNAVRHTPDGTTVEVRVSPGPGGDGVVLTVEDDGPGLGADHVERVFRPFEQGPRSRSLASPGTGIGLALVDRFARLHEGRAWYEDRPGGGSRFHVHLPDDPEQT